MILLDTNVVSEIMKRQPHPAVAACLNRLPLNDLFVPSLVVAEIRYGLRRLPNGRRRQDLIQAFDSFLEAGFPARILVFDAACAAGYAAARATRDEAGRPVAVQDALIGGMALAYGAIVVTRNRADFDGYGLEVLDPWHDA